MTTKITISLPDEAVAAAKQAVREGRAESVSAYVNDALERTYGKQRPLALLVADIIAEHGEPTPEEQRWAEQVFVPIDDAPCAKDER